MEAQCNYDKSWSWTIKEPKMNCKLIKPSNDSNVKVDYYEHGI